MKANKVQFTDINDSMRIDSSYHLSEGTVYLKKIREMPHEELQKLTSSIFTSGRSKRVYTDSKNGYPYLSNSDVVKQKPTDAARYNSKKYGYDESAFLKEGMIVTGRVGAIGQTAYISSEYEALKAMGSDNIIRIVPSNKETSGYLFSFLSSKYGNTLFWKLAAGGVQPYITEGMIRDMPIPLISDSLIRVIHKKIIESTNIRVEANKILIDARTEMFHKLDLPELKSSEYEYFGNHSYGRKPSIFTISSKEMNSTTINAFNYSKKLQVLEERVTSKDHFLLNDCLDQEGFFSTGSFKRLELDSLNSIKLLNQSDIFNIRKQGKMLAKSYVKEGKLVEYGEIIIAGVGTLGEGETFCRVVFGNEELENQLISGEFIRMKTNNDIPPGYLYCWLSSEYGFRFMRKTQTGTKLCRPIPELLKKLPVPMLNMEDMNRIDIKIKKAYTKMNMALVLEDEAIEIVENEIESWQK